MTRDACSGFYAELYNKFDGEREKMQNAMNFPEYLKTIGKIIHLRFIQFGLFPFTFSKATIKQVLFGEVDERANYIIPSVHSWEWSNSNVWTFKRKKDRNWSHNRSFIWICNFWDSKTRQYMEVYVFEQQIVQLWE